MTERGLPIVDGAPACPFVAFADDRDDRATSPDHRHRCYAEAQPAPRALAHQEAYCLSSAFPVCPTFQDWARREAARANSGDAGSRPAADDAAGLSGAAGTAAAAEALDASEADSELPPLAADRPPRRSGHGWSTPPPWLRPTADASASSAAPNPDAPVGPSTGAAAAGLGGAAAAGGLAGSFADRLASGETASRPAPTPAWDEPDGTPGGGQDEAGATTEDLPGRPRRREHERIDAARDHDDEGERDAFGPSWERPRRLEAYPTLRSRRLPAMLLTPLLVAVAAVIIIAALLFLLPSLAGINLGPGAASSPTPALGSAAPSIAAEPTPLAQATPSIYLVQSGDTMSKIAKKFNVPLADLIAANQDTIPNPDKLQIGDQVTIPIPAASVVPGVSTAP
jgi:LysM repeat protein